MNKTELERLQARIHMKARMVMRDGRWVDPKETVVVYRTRRSPAKDEA